MTIQTPFSSSETDDNNSCELVHSFLPKKYSVGPFFLTRALLGGVSISCSDKWEFCTGRLAQLEMAWCDPQPRQSTAVDRISPL